MKYQIWSGRLPPYWYETPWCASDRHALYMLAESTISAIPLNPSQGVGGQVAPWNCRTASTVLLGLSSEVIVTSRIRDGRSHAVLYDFKGYSVTSGALLWLLPPEESSIVVPKGYPPCLQTVTSADKEVLLLDQSRDPATGAVLSGQTHFAMPGQWSVEQWHLVDGTGGMVCRGRASWSAPQTSVHEVRGATGKHLYGISPRNRFWVLDMETGRIVSTMSLSDPSVIGRTGRVLGTKCLRPAPACGVPPDVVVTQAGYVFISRSDSAWLVKRWQDDHVLASFALDEGTAYLMDSAGETGVTVLLETGQDTGSLWYLI